VVRALGGLISIVECSDVAPTADAVAASEKWDKATGEALARWAALQREDLAKANEALQKAGLKAVSGKEAPKAH